MSERTHATSGPGVALLFEDADLSAHLREALVEAGARIVHEGPATKATREDIAGNGADVVVVNLDAKVEQHLDELYEMFDESRQRVVFNDAEASSGLSGWDQARWARHLAAKLLDAQDVDPPRPAESRPVEAQTTELTLPEEEMPEAPPEEPAPEAPEASSSDVGQEVDLTAELEALLAEDGDLLGLGDDEATTSPRAEIDLDEAIDIGGHDPEAMQALADVPAAGEPAAVADTEPASEQTQAETGDEEAAEPEAAEVAPASDEDIIELLDDKPAVGMDEPSGTPDDDEEPAAVSEISLSEDDDEAGDADGNGDTAFEETLRQFDEALADVPDVDSEGDDPHADAEALFKGDDPAALEAAGKSAEAADENEDAAAPAVEATPESTLELAEPGSDTPAADTAKPAKILSEDAGSAFSLVDPDDDSPADPSADEKKAAAEKAKSLSEDAGNAFSLVDPDDDSPADPTAGDKQAAAEKARNLVDDAGSAFSLVDAADDSPVDPTAGKKKDAEAPEAPDWGLVDDDDDDAPPPSPSGLEIMQQNKKPKLVDASEFGIEKMSASEYLSPEDESGGEGADIEPSMSLEIESMEEAIAPKMVGDDEQGTQKAPYGADGDIARVILVGVGSSEEARASFSDFLAGIDGVPNAALIGLVHQQAGEDLDGLVSEWNSTSPIMPVRVAGSDGRTRNGEMIVLPAGKQAIMLPDGHYQTQDAAAQPDASPSIDRTMMLMAHSFKAKVVAIVLAGDAIDALAGAQAVSDGGGKVWTVNPDDYTENTMAAVLGEQNLTEETGSPRELAARMLKELS